jgi:glycosyltransferase involved in cell wall biosynthesis
MTKPPKISIIIPVYNVESYLRTCIDSVANQTYTNLEIILVNDESQDSSGQICEEYALKDKRIKVIHQKNAGAGAARNSGVNVAKGKYIGFVDGDDWVEADMFYTMVTIAEDHNLEIVECSFTEKNSKNDVIAASNSDCKLIVESSVDSYKRIISQTMFSVWRRLYKSKIVKGYNFLEQKTAEDVFFTIDIVIKTNRLGYFPFPFYNYRINPASVTRQSYSKKDFDALEAALYLHDKVVTFFPNNHEIKLIVRQHLLKRLFRHYRLLNYNSSIDPDFKHRLDAKRLIDKHYNKKYGGPIEIKIARYLHPRLFTLLMRLHKLKLKLSRYFK